MPRRTAPDQAEPAVETKRSTARSKDPATDVARVAPASRAKVEAAATPRRAEPAKRTRSAAPSSRAGAARAARDGARPARAASRSSGVARDEHFLAAQQLALLAERATYLDQATSLRAEAELLVEEMEPGDVQFDEESGEGGTVTVDRERDLVLAAQAMAAIEEIDHALSKIESGSYGRCESCDEPIPRPRLEALPYARLCVACKSGGLSRR
jgi:DnaK suppressor protein